MRWDTNLSFSVPDVNIVLCMCYFMNKCICNAQKCKQIIKHYAALLGLYQDTFSFVQIAFVRHDYPSRINS